MSTTIIATSKTAATDAVLEHSRQIINANMNHFNYPDIPQINLDLYCQASILIEAAHAVISAIANNSYEGAPLPYNRVNQLTNDANRMSAEVSNILASRL